MEFSSLKAFLAIAESGSFSAAGKMLFLTQPAVSKRIAVLEQQLGTPLFDRAGRAAYLTEAGETLLPRARQILKDLESATDEVRSLGSLVSGKLRVATSHHIGIHRLPNVLRGFTQRYPAVDLDLQFMDSELAAVDVAAGEIELAVVTLPLQPDKRLETLAVWHDPLLIVCPPEHPLSTLTAVQADDLGRYPAVLPAIGTITRDIVAQYLRDHGIDANIVLETNYLETIRVMVSVGLGWSALPASMLGDEIVAVSVEGLCLSRTLGVVRQKNRTASSAARHFINALAEARDEHCCVNKIPAG